MRHIVILCTCLTLLAGVASAQDATETPLPQAFITGATADVLFPQAIRFTLTTRLPAGAIRAATLALFQSGGEVGRIEVDVADAEQRAGTPGALAVLWTIPLDPVPRLFVAIDAEWEVTSADGQRAGIRASVEFTDARATWTYGGSADGTLGFILAGEFADTATVLRNLQPVYDLIYGAQTPRPSFAWMVYPRPLTPGCSLDAQARPAAVDPAGGEPIPCDPARATALYDAIPIKPIQAESPTSAGAIAAMVDDMVTARYAAAWRNASVPDWFREGFIAFVTPSRKSARLTPMLSGARAERLYTLEAMAAPPRQDELWRDQSFSLVLYIADQIGVDGLAALAGSLGADRPFQAALEAALGQPMRALLPAWQRWLFTDAANSAYSYVPYGPNTPVPTSTPPPTVTAPPTATVTATAPPTATRTPRATGTHTPIPPTPSVTPRPANSLALWTSTPTPAPVVESASPFPGVGLVMLLLVLIAGLVFVYVRLGRTK